MFNYGIVRTVVANCHSHSPTTSKGAQIRNANIAAVMSH